MDLQSLEQALVRQAIRLRPALALKSILIGSYTSTSTNYEDVQQTRPPGHRSTPCGIPSQATGAYDVPGLSQTPI